MKMTKKDYFEAIVNVLKNSGATNAGELMDFCTSQMALCERKSEMAAAKAAQKRAENPDELKMVIAKVLTNNWQSIDQISSKIVPAESTPRIRARLTALIKDGYAVKDLVKNEDGTQQTLYKRL